MLRIGLDVGSTTAKIAVLDDNDKLVYSKYARHHAKVGQLVTNYLQEIQHQFGDKEAVICVTGSVGMATAEQLKAEFVQEVVAATVYAKHVHPEAKALIDIGGEDAKVVFFNKQGMELRMNGNCAGGTGAFLDQMAVLMGIDNQQMNDLALKASHVYPMAARCGVFAKTDVQNLMARNIPEADIAASIFHSVAVQTVTTLSHGCDYEPPILLCGGPLTFLPALRNAFMAFLKLKSNDFIVSKHSNLIPAMGCAIRADENLAGKSAEVTRVSVLLGRLSKDIQLTQKSDLKPLFASAAEHEEWKRHKEQFAVPSDSLHPGVENLFLGIDSGSTTTKIIAMRADGTVVYSYYAPNIGNPIQAVRNGLTKLDELAKQNHTTLQFLGSSSTGYGEDLIRTAFNLDEGIIETMAHYMAAEKLVPNVSFILDIGGQDMKATFVENGAIVRMELNEACSSGCGTFLQTFANNLDYDISDFANLACTAPAPSDLGTRCTVFMNSKVKQVMREGATVADISAGLSYSVVKNCLYKVLKLRGNDSLGDHIVVQGGTMRNDAVVRAFELLSGKEVARSNMPEMMGAYGCALHAMKMYGQNKEKAPASYKNIATLLAGANYTTRQMQCKGCENRCFVSRYNFEGGNKFYSGNKCERVFNNHADTSVTGEDVYPYKYKLLFGRAEENLEDGKDDDKTYRGVIGLPRVLGMYEDFPFWYTFFDALGFKVILSGPSTFVKYEGALQSVMSDNICFPAKLVHSHISELDSRLSKIEHEERYPLAPIIFFPYVIYENKEDELTDNSFNCPIVSAYADVINSSMKLHVQLHSPVINFSNIKLLLKQLTRYCATLHIGKDDTRKALFQALGEQKVYEVAIKHKNLSILEESRKQGKITILLAGRPYHADPLIQHKLSEMIASLGVNVISDDIVRNDDNQNLGDSYLVKQWAYTNRILKAAEWAAEQGDDVHFVEMTSFGCGPDAFVQDEVRDVMRRHGKPFTLLKIDDVSNIGSLKLRVRSLIESLKYKSIRGESQPFVTTKVFRKEDRKRKILAPFFTDFLSPLLPALLHLAGYDVEILPPSDSVSAQKGLQYANNEVCYPATLIVGDMVKALQSGKYDPDKIALVMTQTGGQCRATNYTALIKRAMIANGFEKVPLITLGVTTNGEENEQDGFEFPWLKLASITTNTLLFSDVIAKLFYASVVRENEPGSAHKLKEKYLGLASKCILANDAQGLVKLAGQAAREFDGIIHDKDCPKVGIVGEIFLKFNPFSHQYLEDKLISRGIEVVPPLISPFFLQEFVNVQVQKDLCLKESNVPDFMVKILYQFIARRQKKMNKACRAFRYFRPFTDIYEEAKGATGVVSLAAQFGEGWLLPADIAEFVHDGIKNVVSLQPFGCIANHIVSKGIEKALHRQYPGLNLLSLDFDSGVSDVNVTNRLLLFLDNLTA